VAQRRALIFAVCRETLRFPAFASCAQDELLAAVSTRLSPEEVEKRALRQLDWLKRGGPGAVERLVAVLRANVASVAVQERGCVALTALIADHPDPSPEAKAAVENQMQAAMTAYAVDPLDEARRRAPIAAIYASDLLNHHAANVAKAAAAGAVEVLVTAMLAQPGSFVVQSLGCRLLGILTNPTNADHLARAAAAGAGVALVEAMRAHPADELVNFFAGCALSLLLASFDKTQQSQLGAAGAYDVVLTWMRARQSVAADQKTCCVVLMLLSYDHAANISKAIAAGAVAALVDVMRLHQSNLQLQVAACQFLTILDKGEVGRRRAWRRMDGLFEAVVAAMRAHASDALMQLSGCTLLGGVLAARSAASRARALAAGAAEAVDAAASEHAETAFVQAAALKALAALRGE
jgi:AmiR/NasT family two-component response regulator